MLYDMKIENHADKNPISSHEESCQPPLIGGQGLIEMLKTLIPILGGMGMIGEGESIKNKGLIENSPLGSIKDEDLDDDDATVQEFKKKDGPGGIKGMIKIIKINGPESVEKVAEVIDHLISFRTASRLTAFRQVFSSIQVAQGNSNNEAVTLERLASKHNAGSPGFHQYQAAAALDALAKDASDQNEYREIIASRDAVLSGDQAKYDAAAFRIRNILASYTPSKNIRVAYTYIATQDGEPFLMCPKGNSQVGHPITMEVSKCRDNCIDSRTDREGHITCAYQDWLKVCDNNKAAMTRLDALRHPDNEANLLSLAKGQRRNESLRKEEEATYEVQLEESRQKAKQSKEEGLEVRLDDAKEAYLGHRGEGPRIQDMNDKPASYNARTAQTSLSKPIENQLPNDKADGMTPKEIQIQKNAPVKVTVRPLDGKEKLLDETPGVDGGHRGEMDKSYSQQLNNTSSSVATESYPEETEPKATETEIKSYPEQLNKTAGTKAVELDPDKEETIEQQMEGKHTDPPCDETIEAMLADDQKGLTEDELDRLLEEWLEKEREDRK